MGNIGAACGACTSTRHVQSEQLPDDQVSTCAGHSSSHPVDAAALDVLVAKWSEVIGRAGLRSARGPSCRRISRKFAVAMLGLDVFAVRIPVNEAMRCDITALDDAEHAKMQQRSRRVAEVQWIRHMSGV